MAFIPTAGAVRTDIQYSLAGQQIHNVIWCSRDAAWTQAEREALNDAIAAWWNTSAKSLRNNAMSLVQITTVNQDTENAPSSTLVLAPPVPGSGLGVPLPNNAALCATLRTDLRGRSYRGRQYLAGYQTTGMLDAVTWITTIIADAIGVMGALKTAIDALGAVWVVVSHFHLKQPRAQGLKTPITAVSVDSYIDSQRRRLGLRGV